jgi:hypothetical protein
LLDNNELYSYVDFSSPFLSLEDLIKEDNDSNSIEEFSLERELPKTLYAFFRLVDPHFEISG